MDLKTEIVLNDIAQDYPQHPGIVGFDFRTNTVRITVSSEDIIQELPPTFYSVTLNMEYGVEFTVTPPEVEE